MSEILNTPYKHKRALQYLGLQGPPKTQISTYYGAEDKSPSPQLNNYPEDGPEPGSPQYYRQIHLVNELITANEDNEYLTRISKELDQLNIFKDGMVTIPSHDAHPEDAAKLYELSLEAAGSKSKSKVLALMIAQKVREVHGLSEEDLEARVKIGRYNRNKVLQEVITRKKYYSTNFLPIGEIEELSDSVKASLAETGRELSHTLFSQRKELGALNHSQDPYTLRVYKNEGKTREIDLYSSVEPKSVPRKLNIGPDVHKHARENVQYEDRIFHGKRLNDEMQDAFQALQHVEAMADSLAQTIYVGKDFQTYNGVDFPSVQKILYRHLVLEMHAMERLVKATDKVADQISKPSPPQPGSKQAAAQTEVAPVMSGGERRKFQKKKADDSQPPLFK